MFKRSSNVNFGIFTSSITPLKWEYSPVFMGYLPREWDKLCILCSKPQMCFSTWENHPVLWMNVPYRSSPGPSKNGRKMIIPITPPKWHLPKVPESGYDQHSELWKIHEHPENKWRFRAGKIICFYGPYVP